MISVPNHSPATALRSSEVETFARSDRLLTILHVEVDQFPYLVATCGEAYGEKIRRVLARALEVFAPGGSRTARSGDCRFTVMLRGHTPDALADLVERLRTLLGAYRYPCDGVMVPVSASFVVERG